MFKTSFGTRAAALLVGAAMMSAAPAMAQKQVDVEVQANILDGADQFEVSVVQNPDFGDLTRLSTEVCEYRLSAGASEVRIPDVLSENGIEFVPQATGCSATGQIVAPSVKVSCPVGQQYTAFGEAFAPGLEGLAVAGLSACTSSGEEAPLNITLKVLPSANLGAASLTIPLDVTFE